MRLTCRSGAKPYWFQRLLQHRRLEAHSKPFPQIGAASQKENDTITSWSWGMSTIFVERYIVLESCMVVLIYTGFNGKRQSFSTFAFPRTAFCLYLAHHAKSLFTLKCTSLKLSCFPFLAVPCGVLWLTVVCRVGPSLDFVGREHSFGGFVSLDERWLYRLPLACWECVGSHRLWRWFTLNAQERWWESTSFLFLCIFHNCSLQMIYLEFIMTIFSPS